MTKTLLQSLMTLLVFTFLTGLVYPLAITGIAQLCWPREANGSIVRQQDRIVGSRLLAQPFTGERYFWPRPSATTPAPYNGGSSAGSNLGPTNPAQIDAVKQNLAALQQADPDNHQPVPVDLVTASGSGLDPHISPAAAEYQLGRVARARHLSVERLRALISQHTHLRQWGVFGEPRVNVLELNLALDDLH
ncbi:MAG TPA: potassium-transporting ATPase subunit KdpC [Steroidobacteraceae bacterium]|jgi:K+-transporting ATPase ATPase C chain|nr:potassium-transporting ATPase subunit KdpC [Steroidobacteraceae bacterium]